MLLFVLLLRPRERLRSIVMSMCMCVCLSTCLSVREDISGTTLAIFTIFVHVAYGRGSVLLRQSDEMNRSRDSLGVSPIDNALYS